MVFFILISHIIITQVVKYAQSILSGCPLLTTNDIGIITPYRKQVEKIRLLLQRTGLEDIKVIKYYNGIKSSYYI